MGDASPHSIGCVTDASCAEKDPDIDASGCSTSAARPPQANGATIPTTATAFRSEGPIWPGIVAPVRAGARTCTRLRRRTVGQEQRNLRVRPPVERGVSFLVMTPPRKKGPDEAMREALRAEVAEIERIDALSDEELDRELREAGVDLDDAATSAWHHSPPPEAGRLRAPRRRVWPWIAAFGAIVVLVLAAFAAR
jgi:hypothetical protein